MLLQTERGRSEFVKLFVVSAPQVLIFDRKLKQFCGRQYIHNENFLELLYILNLTYVYLFQLGSVTVLTQQNQKRKAICCIKIQFPCCLECIHNVTKLLLRAARRSLLRGLVHHQCRIVRGLTQDKLSGWYICNSEIV